MPKLDNTKLIKKANDAIEKISEGIRAEDIILQTAKLPIVKVDRENFLRKELRVYYPEEIVEFAIEHNPAYAGVTKECIKKLQNKLSNMKQQKYQLCRF